MARKKNSKLAAVLLGPALVVAGLMALWQNEGRFNYFAAARDATVIPSPFESPVDPVAYTATLRTDIPIAGDYVDAFRGYHLVIRRAEIYAWERSEDSDGKTTWRRGWESSLESNSRNSGLSQRLSSARLYPDRYELGSLEIDPTDIHFVDDTVAVPARALSLSPSGRSLGLASSGAYLYLDKGGADDLGDERVSYTAVPNAARASFFGAISGGRGVARQFEQNDGIIAELIANDGILHHLVNGEREEALARIKADLAKKTWLVRAGGTVAVILGFFIFFSVFASLLYRIPVLGSLVQGGVLLVSAVLGLSLSLLVILGGLLFHNPLTVALPLLLVGGGLFWFLGRSRATGRNARAALERRIGPPSSAAAGAGLAPPPPPPASRDAAPDEAPPATSASATDSIFGLPPRTPASSRRELVERTFVNLAALALVEGGLDRRERRFLERWGRDNELTAERMEALLSAAREDPPELHQASREDLEVLALVALADGTLSRREWDALAAVAARLKVAEKDLRSLLRSIEAGPAPA